MYLRRINVNLYQDIKVLTHYCSTIGKPISGLDIHLPRVSGHGGRCNNPEVLGGKGRINAGFPRIVAFLCNNPGGNGCFSGIIVVLRWPVRPGETERGYGDWTTLGGVLQPCHPERNCNPVILNGTKWSEGSVTDSSLAISSHLHVSKKNVG